jgi:DNA-binding MarR family transcriptional regulator
MHGPSLCTAAKVRRLARRVSQIYDDALAPFGLTIGQLGLLASLRRSRGVPITTLADQLGADPSTISRLLRPLEQAGLLRIDTASHDRRVRLVWLTDIGHQKRQAATAGWHDAQDTLQTRLGDGRLAALRFLLDDASALLEAAQ